MAGSTIHIDSYILEICQGGKGLDKSSLRQKCPGLAEEESFDSERIW